jgi:DNA-binding SARP family transcriptional activator/tetratricopeptide (TPR) repeat protein
VEPQRHLRCLGHPVLFAATGEPIRFRTKKHLALLVYLTVDARSHRRERLAEFLWPCASLVEARHSLATALSTLRPRVGPDALETSRDHVRLLPGRVVTDLQRLQTGDVLGTEVTGLLEVAAFLDGFDIPDSTEFTHWKDGQQARLLPVIKDALVVLIDRCRRTGASRQIEQLADRMLALDELSEEAIRAKMEARAFAGDRLTALEIFEQWKAKLAEDLEAVPSDLVEGMAVRLRRRGWERTTLTNIPNVPTDQWRGRPFVGRTAEYRVLYEAWEGVRKGLPGHALVLGDSGVGKSTLVERLTTAAGLEGAAISRVQCYDLEREIPYSAVSGLILGLLDRPGVSATPPESLAELARTVPEVRHRFPTIPASSDSQGESARIRLTEAFHDMLGAIAEEHPVILVVDDLHLADDVSLAVLHLMMRKARTQPIMVLLIARPGELPQSPQAEKLRMAGGTLGIREMELMPLSDQESLELLQSLIASDQPHPGQTVQRALLRSAAGYPMVLELLVQDWQASGEQSLALSLDAMTTDPGAGGATPAVYRDILDRITRSLDPTTRNVLNLASLLGQRLNDPSMFGLVDLSVGQTMSGLADLVSRRVLRDGARGLEFVNEMVRAAAYVGVPATVRRVLHGKIADRLVLEHDRGSGDLGLEIAWHCMRAGRSLEATPHLLRGAREAIRAGVPFGAERGLATALPSLTGSSRTEAMLLLAEALQEQSRWDESLCVLDQVTPEAGSRLADMAFVLTTKARRRLGHFGIVELASLPATLLAFIEKARDSTSRITAAIEAASLFDTSHTCELARPILASLKGINEQGLSLEDRAQFLLAKSMLFYSIKDFGASMKCIQEGVNMLKSCNASNSVLAMLQLGVGAIFTKQGEYVSSISALHEAYHTAVRIGNDYIYHQASANLSLSLTRLGEYETAIRWAEQALANDRAAIDLAFQLPATRNCILAHAMLGRAAVAETLLRQSQKIFTNEAGGVSQAWTLYAADSLAVLSKQNEAEAQGFLGTSGDNSRLHADFYVGSYARWVARSSLACGSAAIGHERLDALLQNLSRYDAIDQAEILNAKAWLDAHTGVGTTLYLKEMNSRLEMLPTAVRDQLTHMKMLDLLADSREF